MAGRVHIKIGGCDTRRQVFLDNNLVFLCLPSPRAFSAPVRREAVVLGVPLHLRPPLFPRRHAAHLTGKGGRKEQRKGWRRKNEKNPAG